MNKALGGASKCEPISWQANREKLKAYTEDIDSRSVGVNDNSMIPRELEWSSTQTFGCFVDALWMLRCFSVVAARCCTDQF